MQVLYLIKVGEIQLKDGNRTEFSNRLKFDIKHRLSGFKTEIGSREGRFYLKIDESAAEKAEFVLSHTPGINGWARSYKVPKTMADVAAVAVELASRQVAAGARTFKIEARRSDKSFYLESYDIAREIGGAVLSGVPSLSVDVHNPDLVINVEIRDQAYVFAPGGTGIRGLPVGSGGRGLLMLSGGIDSPVAGYRMLHRGLAQESIHFTAYPHTSREAWEKVYALASVLSSWSGGMILHTVPFANVQTLIRLKAREEKSTLYLRACMMMAADMCAKNSRLNSIITGESLGQVASQTAENMRFTQSFTDLPVLRPLVGTDKEDTIREARRIGSYDISIQPYDDCCVLFSSKHPLLKAVYEREREEFLSCGFDSAVAEAVSRTETVSIPFAFRPRQAPSIRLQ